jgi:hypothetical protein
MTQAALNEALATLRQVTIKHRKHITAITKLQVDASVPGQKEAIEEWLVARNACSPIVNANIRALPRGEAHGHLAWFKGKVAEIKSEARKLNTRLDKLLPEAQRPETAATKAAATRRANKERKELLARQVIKIERRDGDGITKATWESGHDQDYDGTGTFTPYRVTLDGVSTDGYGGPGGFYLPAEVERDGPVNLHQGRDRTALQEISAGLRTF